MDMAHSMKTRERCAPLATWVLASGTAFSGRGTGYMQVGRATTRPSSVVPACCWFSCVYLSMTNSSAFAMSSGRRAAVVSARRATVHETGRIRLILKILILV